MATKVRGELFTGRKGRRLEDLPEEAWTVLTGEAGSDDRRQLFGVVSWLYRCVDIRAQAVASMPWEVRRGDVVVASPDIAAQEGLTWLNELPDLLYRTEAALTLTGRAYWFRERNLLRTLAVRWLRPDSVTPDIGRDGLRGFTRRIGNDDLRLDVDDVVYFWMPDPFVELGPAENYPGKAALAAAGVLRSMEQFLTDYFERGMVKATLLKYSTPMGPDESRRVKEWWKRVATGVKNAFATEVVRGDFEPLVVGEGLTDLQNSALTAEQRESIATALGVPQSKITANAANYATKESDDRMFITDTVAPACRWLETVINRQLLEPMGLTLQFMPEELSVMQEDEASRASSLNLLVSAGMSLEMAVAVLGYDLPDDIELREPVAETPPQLLPFTGQPVAADNDDDDRRMAETRRFVRWARKRKAADPAAFQSDVLTLDERTALLADLQEDGDTADDAPFPVALDWESYP